MNDESEPKDSIRGILRSAINIEKFGIRYYTALSSAVEDKTGKEFIDYLVDAEQKHQRSLEQEYDKQKEFGAETLKPLPMDNLDDDGQQVIFSESLEDYEPGDVGIGEAIKFGIHVEERSIKFYSNAAKLVHDPALKEILSELVKFEQEHLELFKKNFSQFLN